MPASALAPEQSRAAAHELAWRERLQLALTGSFVAFLYFCAIQDVRGGTDRLPWLVEGTHLERGAIRFKRWAYLVGRAEAWERGESEVVLKARQLGFTWLAAAYALFVAMRPGARVLIISKGQLEAYAFLERMKFIHERLPLPLRRPMVTDNEGEKRFKGGGQVLALPSTRNAGRGFTGSLLIFDENAFHAWASQNWKAARATVADVGQTLVMSTANGASGHFHDLYRQAEQWQRELREMQRARDVAIDAGRHEEAEHVGKAMTALARAALRPVFIAALARPDRTVEWLEAERKLYVGMPEEFNVEYPMRPEDAFIQLRGLVYPQFNPETHVSEQPPVPWEQCQYRIASYDLGGGDMTAFTFLGAYRRPGDVWRIHQYGEWGRREVLTADRANEVLLEWHRVAPIDLLECDPREPTLCATLAAAYGWPAQLANWNRQEGLGIVASWLDAGTLTIAQGCEGSIAEFSAYRWVERVDPNDKTRYATSTPAWTHGDWMDARRYGMVRAHYLLLAEDEGPRYTSVRWA